MGAPTLPARMIEAVQRIEAEFKGKIVRTEPIQITNQVTTAFPPCIAQIHEDSIQGKNLAHEARFALASFLLKIGMTEEEVKNVFKPAPDFMSSLAEYQVHHIARKSAGEGYTPPGCKKMQGNSLCPVYLGTIFDSLCEYVLHPLGFYRTRVWEMTRPNPITDHSWYSRKMRKKQNF
jgi:DNA primase large subunit